MTAKQLIDILGEFKPDEPVQIFTSRYCGGGDEWANAGDTPVVLTTEYGGVFLTPDFEEEYALYQLRGTTPVKAA